MGEEDKREDSKTKSNLNGIPIKQTNTKKLLILILFIIGAYGVNALFLWYGYTWNTADDSVLNTQPFRLLKSLLFPLWAWFLAFFFIVYPTITIFRDSTLSKLLKVILLILLVVPLVLSMRWLFLVIFVVFLFPSI